MAKAVVVLYPIGKLDVDGRVALFHQFKVGQKATYTPVAVDEMMYRFKHQVKRCSSLNNVQLFHFPVIIKHQPLHFNSHFVWLAGIKATAPDGYTPVHAIIRLHVHKDEGVYLFYGSLGNGDFAFD